jgi:hypothetical protein
MATASKKKVAKSVTKGKARTKSGKRLRPSKGLNSVLPLSHSTRSY